MGRESPGLINFQQSQEQQRQFSLFFIDYLLFFIDYLLLFIVYSLLIIVYSLLISVYSLLIIFYSLLIIVYSLLIFFYSSLILVHYLSIIFLFYIYYCILQKMWKPWSRGRGQDQISRGTEFDPTMRSLPFFTVKIARNFR